jgi:hypothetical protein
MRVALAGFALVGLLFTTCVRAAVYDPQQAKGYPRLRDEDSVKVMLFSLYENSTVVIDAVRFPKPEKDSVVEIVACFRLAPSSVAQCVVRLKLLDMAFAIEVPLNIQEV